MLFSLHADRWDEVIERKIKYDQKLWNIPVSC